MPIKVVNIRAVRQRAAAAIHDRLKGSNYGGPDRCIISIHRDPDTPRAVIAHLNSGGNACAVRNRLNAVGYRAEWIPLDPRLVTSARHRDYGALVRILPGVSG